LTVVDTSPPPDIVPAGHRPSSRAEELRVEPTIGLEWSQAIEQWGNERATRPAEARGAWVHRAPEEQVLALYLKAREYDSELPAPWWLRAMADGLIRDRTEGFTVEDRVAKLLASRPGWIFVPWADGDVGFWEYMPSERALSAPGVPTTLVLTHRHVGWLDVIPVHPGDTGPRPIPVQGLADLRSNLARLESLRPGTHGGPVGFLA
jgi:hypothetical protein